MIIGIDDSGNFKTEISYFTAVLLKPSEYEKFSEEFVNWEKITRKTFNISGEIKGKSLNTTAMMSFINLLDQTISPYFRIVSNCVKPTTTEETSSYLELQQEILNASMEEGIQFYLKRDNGSLNYK